MDDLHFLQAILEDPNDDFIRLSFADWLEERGQPGDGERAEFIRVQCELARIKKYIDDMKGLVGSIAAKANRLHRRERELLGENISVWLNSLPDGFRCANVENRPTSSPVALFRRGFVAAITCTAADWLKHADELAWHPSQEMACPACLGSGQDRSSSQDGRKYVCERCMAVSEIPIISGVRCPHCGSDFMCKYRLGSCGHCKKGRLPRPMPATAQPIEEVTLVAYDSYASQRFYQEINADKLCAEQWSWIKFNLPQGE